MNQCWESVYRWSVMVFRQREREKGNFDHVQKKTTHSLCYGLSRYIGPEVNMSMYMQ
jgi:hypothetical protein